MRKLLKYIPILLVVLGFNTNAQEIQFSDTFNENQRNQIGSLILFTLSSEGIPADYFEDKVFLVDTYYAPFSLGKSTHSDNFDTLSIFLRHHPTNEGEFKLSWFVAETIIHETVHIAQMFYNGLRVKDGVFTWEGEEIHYSDLDYSDRPWEVEANKKAKIILLEYTEIVETLNRYMKP